ncbi:MAG TPA: DUF4249 domain-containing protein [Bacteroidales bacterium]|nr:DUF4249 domain-containing protein [Bacteroidales bacterium]
MKLIYHSCLFLLIIFLSACETPISLTIPHHKNPLVIEGWIDNDRPATVIVSRSLSYYTEITLATILQSIDTTAQVIVSDDEGNSETLSLGFSADHLYGLLGKAYVGKNIKGKIGHSYQLTVKTKDKVYTTSTTIPKTPVLIDTLYFNRKSEKDTTATIRILFHDKGDEMNYYRFFTQIKGLDMTFSQVSIGVFDDLTFNGLTLNFELVRMPVSNMVTANMTQEEYENYYRISFRPGDVIFIKSTTIDQKTQKYWSSLQSELSSGQNPYITPGNHPTNIIGENVTGIWSGYNVRYDTLIFQK